MRPSPAELRTILAYDEDTGVLTWIARPLEGFKRRKDWVYWHNRWAGQTAGSPKPGEYVEIGVLGHKLKAHRVIWALVYGEWPEGEIDHINGDKHDNRLSNLRLVSHAENMKNQVRYRNNATGLTGVSVHKATGKYVAQISNAGKRRHLGLFDDAQEAHAAYLRAKADLGFSERHGA